MTERLAWAHGVRYVDTHCHVDLFPDPTAVMREADGQGVGIVAVTNAPSVFEPMVRLAADFPKVAVALGLHPELAGERESELRFMPELMQRTDFIGEIGLDGAGRDGRALASQRRVLQAILEVAKKTGPKTMTVHTRRAARETLETLAHTSGSVILHWFSGTSAQAKEATERGWWFSVNAAMLESAKGRALVQSLPQRVVLTETDGPFTSLDGRPARPSDVPEVVDKLAAMWGVDHEVARLRLLDNFRSCLSAAVPGPSCDAT
ncbi:MAG TPA: Qat anti-phage system TatD family nuclease QatD [Candidatus Polarisedimenticolia bacterium]|nr:Qat anti-phage system TatD family nuclease QatD [Candidatus Polarisedimenticolia bacterium]